MGMDFRYQGSASYPRFDREMEKIAEVFGGKLAPEFQQKKEYDEAHQTLDYWFGFTSSDSSDRPKFLFKSKTAKTLVKFFNHPYGRFTPNETKFIWRKFREHPEIEEISYQIWHELRDLCRYGEAWELS